MTDVATEQYVADGLASVLVTVPGKVFDVSRFGAVGDGAADDTAAIQAALTALAAAGGGELRFPPGAFLVSAKLSLPERCLVRGAGKGVTRILQDPTSGPTAILDATGDVGPWVTCTVSVGKGTSAVTAPTHGLVVGDLFVLADDYSYTSTDASYKSGEMLRVASVDGDDITVHGFVAGSWATSNGAYTTTNGVRIAKILPRNGVKVCDLTVRTRPDQPSCAGIRATWVNQFTVDSCEIESGSGNGIRVHGCRNVTITNATIQDMTDDIANLTIGYAIAVSGPCSGVVISGANIARVRHAFTTGGSIHGMPHRVTVCDSTASECTTTAWDTHAAGEDILFDGLIATGSNCGIVIRSRGTVVQNCYVAARDADADPGIVVAETNAKNVTIRNNTVIGARYGVHIPNSSQGGFLIQGNHLEDIGRVGIGVNGSAPNVRIVNNVLINYSLTVTRQAGIQNLAPTGALASGSAWMVVGNTLHVTAGQTAGNAIAVTVAGLSGVLVANNVWAGAHAFVLGVTATTASNNVRLGP